MLQLVHLDRMEERLRTVPALVDAQQRRETDFPHRVVRWLMETEAVVTDARHPAVSQLASLRSRLLTTMHGAGGAEPPRGGRRKHIEAVTSDVLQRAQQVLATIIEPKLEQLREAESIATRVAAVARAKGVLERAKTIPDHQAALGFVHHSVSHDPDTAAATVHLSGILGPIDALVVLDRALPDLVAPSPEGGSP